MVGRFDVSLWVGRVCPNNVRKDFTKLFVRKNLSFCGVIGWLKSRKDFDKVIILKRRV